MTTAPKAGDAGSRSRRRVPEVVREAAESSRTSLIGSDRSGWRPVPLCLAWIFAVAVAVVVTGCGSVTVAPPDAPGADGSVAPATMPAPIDVDGSIAPPAPGDGSDTLWIGQAGTWMGDPGATSVVVIGDSLVFQAEGNRTSPGGSRSVAEALAASGYRAYVSSWVGSTIAQAHDQVWPALAGETDIDVLVLALGTNDVKTGTALADSRSTLSVWLDEEPRARCVAVVGLDEQAYGWGLDVGGPPFNAMLRDLAGARTDTVFVAWEPDPAVHGSDGDVHLTTPEAQGEYRTALEGAVGACARRLGEAPSDATG